MDPKKAEMKNVGSKLAEEHLEQGNKDMSKELENLNKIRDDKEQPIIKINYYIFEKDKEKWIQKRPK